MIDSWVDKKYKRKILLLSRSCKGKNRTMYKDIFILDIEFDEYNNMQRRELHCIWKQA